MTVRELLSVPCPACGSNAVEAFHHEPSLPTNSCLLLDNADEAAAFPRGELRLGFCSRCGFVFNGRFDEAKAEYSARYEETQGYSQRFVDFATHLAKRWVVDHDLVGKTVLEIGCGKGEFLEYMVEAGAGHGIGIDPGLHPERLRPELADRMTAICDFYTEDYHHLEVDAIVCRHTLEHIAPVGEFMRTIRANIGDRTDVVVLFELPDVARVLEEVAFWDVYYEHCSYFSTGSLARLFRSTGFEVTNVELDYDDQYIVIEAVPSTVPGAGLPLPIEDDMDRLRAGSSTFELGYQKLLTEWRGRLSALVEDGGKAVIWGAGSKGVSFLTNLGADAPIDFAVDINPHKHGMYLAGTGQKTVPPDFLADYKPELVIAMNPIYLAEIQADLDRLGLTADLVAV